MFVRGLGLATLNDIKDITSLSQFVHHALCELDHLDQAQTPLFKLPLRKANNICGYVFHIEGPRLLRTSAVWNADDNRILIYDSQGERVKEIHLLEEISLDQQQKTAA